MTTSPEAWAYRINLLASGTYPWVPCAADEGEEIRRQGYVVLPSGVKFPAIAKPLEEINDLA